MAKQEKAKHPGVYNRGDSYFVRYRANGKRHGVSCSTLKEALEVKRSRETARDRGEHDLVTEGKVPFADYALYAGRRVRCADGSTWFAEVEVIVEDDVFGVQLPVCL